MMNAQKAYRDDKIIVLADTEYFTARNRERNQEKKKLSRIMAMVLGAIVTAELLIMGAMFMNIDFRSADRIALIFGAAVLYFGVVALLTDN